MSIVIKEREELPNSNSNQAFVKLFNVLEKGLQDLEIIGMSDEVANVYTIKLLQKKLSHRILTKWLDKDSVYDAETDANGEKKKRDGKAKFNQLF